MVNRYRNQMGELPAYTSATSQSETEVSTKIQVRV
jgi:hypothetical protein